MIAVLRPYTEVRGLSSVIPYAGARAEEVRAARYISRASLGALARYIVLHRIIVSLLGTETGCIAGVPVDWVELGNELFDVYQAFNLFIYSFV